MTPEHKAKMAAGRERARQARQSRGRPAYQAETAPMPRERAPEQATDPVLELPDYANLERTLTRQSRANGDNTFDIPMRGRIPGWDYQWWPTHVVGQEVDPSETVNYLMGGWREVPATMFPTLCPPGWQRKSIDRQGQRLYMRPMRLTEEALAEQKSLAMEQKRAKLMQAQAGDAGREFAPRVDNGGIKTELRPLLE